MRQTLKIPIQIKVKIAMFFAVRLWVYLEIISAIKLIKSKTIPIINPMINIFLKSRKIKTCNEIKVIAG